MPDKPLTVLTYAASASLAAIALIYFFNPNHLIDGEGSKSSASTRKKGIVGLVNPANDCFINCILQSLAGLGDLRLYLIREVHRRELSDPTIYASVPEQDKDGNKTDPLKLASLQRGEVTQGLKLMIDRLNERPIHKKTISASNFVLVLENAFGSRISKTQQDAQELLQVVAERLAEEYHAGKDARKRAFEGVPSGPTDEVGDGHEVERPNHNGQPPESSNETSEMESPDASFATEPEIGSTDEEYGFPLEGTTEAGIECKHCRFKPKPNITNFVMLNLMVPHKISTTLNDCLDEHFKTEDIDDYTCDQCRLQHAQDVFGKALFATKSQEEKATIRENLRKVVMALHEDPEHPPEGVELPSISLAPKRQVARHVQITKFPKILVVHLSRSVYDSGNISTKNMAKVSFPEKLPLGGILNRRKYNLLGMVTHKGTHNSGHYEAFRRQHLYAPYSTPHNKRPSGPYSAVVTPELSAAQSPSLPAQAMALDPRLSADASAGDKPSKIPSISSSDPSISSNSLRSSPTRPPSGAISDVAIPHPAQLPAASLGKENPLSNDSEMSPKNPKVDEGRKGSSIDMSRLKRKKKVSERWWRISDDKIKECSTSDVLAMQKDVYMLFYEMDRGE